MTALTTRAKVGPGEFDVARQFVLLRERRGVSERQFPRDTEEPLVAILLRGEGAG